MLCNVKACLLRCTKSSFFFYSPWAYYLQKTEQNLPRRPYLIWLGYKTFLHLLDCGMIVSHSSTLEAFNQEGGFLTSSRFLFSFFLIIQGGEFIYFLFFIKLCEMIFVHINVYFWVIIIIFGFSVGILYIDEIKFLVHYLICLSNF